MIAKVVAIVSVVICDFPYKFYFTNVSKSNCTSYFETSINHNIIGVPTLFEEFCRYLWASHLCTIQYILIRP